MRDQSYFGCRRNCQLALPDFRAELVVNSTCGTLSITQSPPAGTIVGVGPTVVTFTVSDSLGSNATCQATMTVQDTTAPVINCPANITTVSEPGVCDAAVTFVVTATDNCDASPLIVCTPASGSRFAKGVTTVNCAASDVGLNTNNCSFTVTVNDTQAPSIVCPTNMIVKLNTGESSRAISYTTPAGNDNCPGVLVACSPASGSTFTPGATTVNCTATDTSGNTANCSFTVTLQGDNGPVAVGDTVFTARNTPRDIDAAVLLVNDTDADGDTLSISSVTSPSRAGGTVALSGSTVTYTPAAGFTGSDTFDYTITDGRNGSSTATVCVRVEANTNNFAFREPTGGWTYVYDGSGVQGIGTARRRSLLTASGVATTARPNGMVRIAAPAMGSLAASRRPTAL